MQGVNAPPSGDSKDGHPARPLILCVEDDADTREMYTIVLEDAGFRVTGARRGEEGLQLAAAMHPDIILTDISMPGMLDGYSMTRLLKANISTCAIPVVAVSGYHAAEVGALAEFQAVLTKPVQHEMLVASLRGILARAPAT